MCSQEKRKKNEGKKASRDVLLLSKKVAAVKKATTVHQGTNYGAYPMNQTNEYITALTT